MSRQAPESLGMRDVWNWALSWYRKPPTSPTKRAKQARLVAAILAELRTIGTVADLHDLYRSDSRWCLKLAQRLYPTDWPTVGVHATTATAYGLRYVEILTGRPLDPTNLPRWTGEWAIW